MALRMGHNQWSNAAVHRLHGLGLCGRFRGRVRNGCGCFRLFESGNERQYGYARHPECRDFPGRAFQKIDCVARIHG
jgi:hypothetical protein